MAVPQLDNCCCSCTISLRVGTKIIGWFCFITSAYVVLFNVPIDIVALQEIEKDPKVPVSVKQQIPVAEVALIVIGLFNSFHGFVSALLLIGAYKNKASYLLWWIYTSLLIAIVSLLAEIAKSFVAFDLASIMARMVVTALSLYFTLVVYSFYREIRNGTDENTA